MKICEIIINIIISLVCGFASGLFVYIMTKKREKQNEVYRFWLNFLFDALKHCEMFIPYETLDYMKYIKDKDGKFYDAIQNILDNINPFGHEDKVFSDKEEAISKNVLIALKELEKGKNK